LDANISAYDLASTYMPGFETAIVQGGAMGIMCSYNSVNGRPTCASPNLTKVLRDDWKFDGYITSDTDACSDIYKSHHFAQSAQEATADCLAGGTDVNSGNTYKANLAPGVEDGTVRLEDAQAALRNAYRFRMRLGLFDGPNVSGANWDFNASVVGADAHRASSLDASKQSMVLLKNDASRGLPFSAGKKLVVVGVDANNVVATLGNYVGNNICHGGSAAVRAEGGVDVSCLRSYWEVLNATNAAAGGTATLMSSGSGGNVQSWDAKAIAAAVAAAKSADNVLVVISNAEDEGGESHDRASIGLASDQMAMASAVFAAVAPLTNVHASLLLINGAISAFDDVLNDAAPSVLETFMPGPYGGEAVASTVWGKNVPGGKMPSTIYYSNYTDGCDIDDMIMSACGGRTYV
jgi:hypothetical protein